MRALFRPLGFLCLWAIFIGAFFLSEPILLLSDELSELPITTNVEKIVQDANRIVPDIINGFFARLPLPEKVPVLTFGDFYKEWLYGAIGIGLIYLGYRWSRKTLKTE